MVIFLFRFEKVSSSKMRRTMMKAVMPKIANVAERRSAVALNARRKSSSTRTILILSAKLSRSGNGSHRHRFV
jgi:hypothetical protein